MTEFLDLLNLVMFLVMLFASASLEMNRRESFDPFRSNMMRLGSIMVIVAYASIALGIGFLKKHLEGAV